MNESLILEMEIKKALNLYEAHADPLKNEIEARMLEIDEVCSKNAASKHVRLVSKLFILKVIQKYARHFAESSNDLQNIENFSLLAQLFQVIEKHEKQYPFNLKDILLFISCKVENQNIDIDCFYKVEKLVKYFVKLDEDKKNIIQTKYTDLKDLFDQYSIFLKQYFKKFSIGFTENFESEVNFFESYEQLDSKKSKAFLFNSMLSEIKNIQSTKHKPSLPFFSEQKPKEIHERFSDLIGKLFNSTREICHLLKNLDEETIFFENYGNGMQKDSLSEMHTYVSNLRKLLAERLTSLDDNTELSLEFINEANVKDVIKLDSSGVETKYFIGRGTTSEVHLSFPFDAKENVIRFSEPQADHRLYRRIPRNSQTVYVKVGEGLKTEPFIPGTGHLREFFKILSQRNEVFSCEDLLSIYLQFSMHLSEIHQQGIIHREINENNSLIYMDFSDKGKKVQARLIDFSFAAYCFNPFFRAKTEFNDLHELISLFQSILAYVTTFTPLEYGKFELFLKELEDKIQQKEIKTGQDLHVQIKSFADQHQISPTPELQKQDYWPIEDLDLYINNLENNERISEGTFKVVLNR